MTKITLSVIKADIGGFVGHSDVHEDCLLKAEEILSKSDLFVDWRVMNVGDDVNLVLLHKHGVENKKVHKEAYNIFLALTEIAKELRLYGAGQDLLSDAFSGNIKGMGPGVAEMEFEVRTSEPTLIFMADKTSPGAWNMPIYKMFADPFNTAGLVLDPSMTDGFVFDILDVMENKSIKLSTPEDSYKILALIGSVNRYAIRAVYKKDKVFWRVTFSQ